MKLFIVEVKFSTLENGAVKNHSHEYEMVCESSAIAGMRIAQRVMNFFKARPESQIRVNKMNVRLA